MNGQTFVRHSGGDVKKAAGGEFAVFGRGRGWRKRYEKHQHLDSI